MDTLRFAHLMRIAATDIPAPEEVVKEIAAKFYDRYMTFAKGFAALSATILTTFIVPGFGPNNGYLQFRISWYCALVCLSCSLLSLLRAFEYARRYTHMLRVVDRLRSIRLLLQAWGY